MTDNLFAKNFSLDRVPHWPCPTCSKGTLRLKKEDFRAEYDGETAAYASDPMFDYEWVRFVFHGLLRCNLCLEKVAICGSGEKEQQYDNYEEEWRYHDSFQPTFFHPTVRLIFIANREAVPSDVLSALDKACALFWADYDSCANRIRTTVEYILDDLRVPRKHLTLHARIALLDSATQGDIKTILEAVKWIGNAGTHKSGELSREAVIEGFMMLEHCLSVLYPKLPFNTIGLLTRAREINEAKGPVSPRSSDH
jgi:hypothetical protein